MWQARFYDFNACTERKRVEKLRYMHNNPVKRGLVLEPEQWRWSSFRFKTALGGATSFVVYRERKNDQRVGQPP